MAGPKSAQLLKGKLRSVVPSTLNGAPQLFVKANRNEPSPGTLSPAIYGAVATTAPLLEAKIVSEQ